MTTKTYTPTKTYSRTDLEAGAALFTERYSYVTQIMSAQLNDFGVIVVRYVGPSAAQDAFGRPIQATFTRYVDSREARGILEEMEEEITE